MDTKPKPPQCPIHNRACSTAYTHRKCRCEACRAWKSERAQDYRKRNPEACRERERKWKKENQDSVRQYNKEYGKKRYENNREELLKQQKEYREANKEEISEKRRLQYQANPEPARERSRLNREKNPERNRENCRRWYQNNKADYAARNAARKANMKISHLPLEEQELIHKIYEKAQEFKDQGLDVHVDHVIPLSKDGTHTSDNLVIISAEDNMFKSDKEISSRTTTHMIVEGREIEILYPHY